MKTLEDSAILFPIVFGFFLLGYLLLLCYIYGDLVQSLIKEEKKKNFVNYRNTIKSIMRKRRIVLFLIIIKNLSPRGLSS